MSKESWNIGMWGEKGQKGGSIRKMADFSQVINGKNGNFLLNSDFFFISLRPEKRIKVNHRGCRSQIP